MKKWMVCIHYPGSLSQFGQNKTEWSRWLAATWTTQQWYWQWQLYWSNQWNYSIESILILNIDNCEVVKCKNVESDLVVWKVLKFNIKSSRDLTFNPQKNLRWISATYCKRTYFFHYLTSRRVFLPYPKRLAKAGFETIFNSFKREIPLRSSVGHTSYKMD